MDATAIEFEALDLPNGEGRHTRSQEWIFTAVSIGLFLIIVGSIFLSTPSLYNSVVTFFEDIILVKPISDLPIQLPAPETPGAHTMVYDALMQFSLIWGIAQVLMVVLRFALRSKSGKRAEAIGDTVFWLGTYYFIQRLLNVTTTSNEWFQFWAIVIMLGGLSLVIRAIYLAIDPPNSWKR